MWLQKQSGKKTGQKPSLRQRVQELGLMAAADTINFAAYAGVEAYLYGTPDRTTLGLKYASWRAQVFLAKQSHKFLSNKQKS